MERNVTQFENNECFDKESEKYVRFVKLIEEIRAKYSCFKSAEETHGGVPFKHNMNKRGDNHRKTTHYTSKKYVKPVALQRLEKDTSDNSIQVIRSQLNKLSDENFSKICFFINFKLNNIEDLATLIFKFCESSNVYTNLYSAILLYSIDFINQTKKKQLMKTVHTYFDRIFNFNSQTTQQLAGWCNDSYDEFCLEVKLKKHHVNNIHFLYFMSQSDKLQLDCFHEQVLCFYVNQAKESYTAEHIDWKNIEIALDSCITWCSINAQQKYIPVFKNDTFVNTKTKNLLDKTDLKHCVEILDEFDLSNNLKLKFKLLDLKDLIAQHLSNI